MFCIQGVIYKNVGLTCFEYKIISSYKTFVKQPMITGQTLWDATGNLWTKYQWRRHGHKLNTVQSVNLNNHRLQEYSTVCFIGDTQVFIIEWQLLHGDDKLVPPLLAIISGGHIHGMYLNMSSKWPHKGISTVSCITQMHLMLTVQAAFMPTNNEDSLVKHHHCPHICSTLHSSYVLLQFCTTRTCGWDGEVYTMWFPSNETLESHCISDWNSKSCSIPLTLWLSWLNGG